MSTYTIEYRQVNINVGDCEIILLLEDIGGTNTIKYSVMVDGGNGGFARIENIRRALKRIADKYKLAPATLKLDALVISHWDQDHFFGIFQLLADDLEASTLTPPQVSFLKYDSTTGSPQSMIYIPYKADKSVAKYKADYSTVGGVDEFGFTSAGTTIRICKYRADKVGCDENLLKGSPVELASTDESELIGRNLFTDQRPTLAQVVSANSPQALVTLHTTTMPGLYCVAANNRYLKGSKSSAPLKNDGTTKTNRSSIVCMVIRPDGTASHYLAGDAHQELEAKVIDWTGLDEDTPTSPRTDKERMAIVKASHHGAPTSTPITMCQKYKPIYFLFSAGTKHRHPAWEVLFYVYSYYISPLGQNVRPRYNIRTISYPYWLTPEKDGMMLVGADDPLTDTTGEANKYRTTIAGFFTPSTIGDSLLDKFNADGIATKTKTERSDWIREISKTVILGLISPTGTTLSSDSTSTMPNFKTSSIVILSDGTSHVIEIEEINPQIASPPATFKRSASIPAPDDDAPKKKRHDSG